MHDSLNSVSVSVRPKRFPKCMIEHRKARQCTGAAIRTDTLTCRPAEDESCGFSTDSYTFCGCYTALGEKGSKDGFEKSATLSILYT